LPGYHGISFRHLLSHWCDYHQTVEGTDRWESPWRDTGDQLCWSFSWLWHRGISRNYRGICKQQHVVRLYEAPEADTLQWVTHQGHAIIGTIVTALLLLQPIAGLIHHRSYSKYGKRTALGIAHRWNGRILLVLGVINGGLGLWLADEDKNFIIPYSVVAAVVYLSWLAIAIWKGRKGSDRKTSATSSI
jgi:hypothetical protein